jgi:predicted DNA-binding transcriptional regulator YafY
LIAENSKEVVVELYIVVSYDFVMELLSCGSSVKVLQPKSLMNELKAELNKSLGLYENNW